MQGLPPTKLQNGVGWQENLKVEMEGPERETEASFI